MNTLSKGGNPTQDRKESMERFKTIIEPIFKGLQFKRLKGNSQFMYNEETNTMLIVTACPSQTNMPRATRDRIKQWRKVYGLNLKCYLLYTRDYSEWESKPTYVSTLRYMMNIKQLNGIGTGLKNLPMFINRITNGELFFAIS